MAREAVEDDGDSREAPGSADAPGLHIVGIGASAGGLESLERFFTHLPADTGMAFVVLQHLSPDFKSLMDELLARRTRCRSAWPSTACWSSRTRLSDPADEGDDHPAAAAAAERPGSAAGLTLPIDLFFRSLAQDLGERAVAVVLSGSGSDGSRGLREVSHAGGTGASAKAPTGAVQRHAAQRDAHRHRRSGAGARGDRRGDCGAGRRRARRLPPTRRRPARSAASTRSCGCCATSTRSTSRTTRRAPSPGASSAASRSIARSTSTCTSSSCAAIRAS